MKKVKINSSIGTTSILNNVDNNFNRLNSNSHQTNTQKRSRTGSISGRLR